MTKEEAEQQLGSFEEDQQKILFDFLPQDVSAEGRHARRPLDSVVLWCFLFRIIPNREDVHTLAATHPLPILSFFDN